ncbi:MULTISPECIES: sensor histidine kinase [Streptomyces]|uniref:histidine kinase n=2 Tax=Streptomyces TaxID=1883 RepID=A0ABQ3NFG1_STRVG|nr:MULTISPECIES: histidine kinase [Streptomyces]KOU14273.1 histidine kinase [Streptomyces sp. WM6349]KOU97438.1 histidine kinase [Streptomyces sp. XY511]KOV08815.1 histidine kinase [Streptomyces sp. XY533]KOV38820.1 histidine kinase [Streptomyces sp. H036]MBP2346824.1 signal transduction histidine kinase [Streptomyces virginiae]
MIPALGRRVRRLRGARPWVVDLGLTVLVQLAVTMPFVLPREPGLPPVTWAAYAVTTLSVVPLVWRRRRPVLVLMAILLVGGVYKVAMDGPGQPLPYAGLMAFYTVALQCPGRVRAAVGAGSVVAVGASVGLGTGTARELSFTLFCAGAAYALGRLQYTRQAYTAAVEDRAAQLERANRIEAEQAVARERARIAREMHDILSHAVSIMIVQAEAGPVAVRRAPERAEAAFEAISETGREAMAQLRTMLGVLREADGPAPREPQPGVAALPALLDRVRRGGPEIAYEETGEVRGLSPAVDTAVYRIVQEALTNVVKHARARRVGVRLHHGARELAVTVTDDGRGQAGGGAGGGHGLIGIRERAAAHGGTAVCGPGPDGTGFSVRAVLVTSPLEVGN